MKKKHPPFFTIITATYNAQSTLPCLLESLAKQRCQDFVWVCQDGASTDGTMEIARAWQDKIHISAHSEKDNGIYDAWNKAIAREDHNLGEWVLFLGADDQLHDEDVLTKVQCTLSQLNHDVLFGVGEVEFYVTGSNYSHTSHTDIHTNFANRMIKNPFAHTGLFSRSNTIRQNRFNIKFKIAGDQDWILQTWKHPSQAHHLQQVTTKMLLGGISSSAHNRRIVYWENFKACANNFPFRIFHYIGLNMYATWKYKWWRGKLQVKNICQKHHLLQNLWSFLQRTRKKMLKTND